MDTRKIWEQVAEDLQRDQKNDHFHWEKFNPDKIKKSDQINLQIARLEVVAAIISDGLKQYSRGLIDYSNDQILYAINKFIGWLHDDTKWMDFLKPVCRNLPGCWQKLMVPDGFRASSMLLLTDGSIILQTSGGKSWKRLKADKFGNYPNDDPNLWGEIENMALDRENYASAVLINGKVFVSGGEYVRSKRTGQPVDTNQTEIFNPETNQWERQSAPEGEGWRKIGDAPCCVLADGKLLLGSTTQPVTAVFDPIDHQWTDHQPERQSRSHEESWVLLPDGSVLTVQCNTERKSERYVPGKGWKSAGQVPVDLVEPTSDEIGAGILLTNGKAIFLGATGLTALYDSASHTWSAGPPLPLRYERGKKITIGCKDSPSCLLTNGKVLISAGEITGRAQDYGRTTYFYEYDPDRNRIDRIPSPGHNTHSPWRGRMLLLPNGQVLYTSGSDTMYLYTYCSWIDDSSWRPEIRGVIGVMEDHEGQLKTAPAPQPKIHDIQPGGTYRLDGRRLTGLSQTVGYGDDYSAATNYPLVFIVNDDTKHKQFCRTFNHSNMGVATGDLPQHTHFTVPESIEEGWSSIYVIANGIEALDPFSVHVSGRSNLAGKEEIKKEPAADAQVAP